MVAITTEEFKQKREAESVRLTMMFADVLHQYFGIILRPKIICRVSCHWKETFQVSLEQSDVSAGVTPHQIGSFSLNFPFQNGIRVTRWLRESIIRQGLGIELQRNNAGIKNFSFLLAGDPDKVVQVVQLINIAMFMLDPCITTDRRCPSCRQSDSDPAYLYDDGEVLTCARCDMTFGRHLLESVAT